MIRISPPNLRKLLLLLAASQILLVFMLGAGTTKAWGQVDWLDILAEGGAAAIVLVWLLFVAASRPAGTVTNFLLAGLACMFIAFWQDLVDEIVELGSESLVLSMLESALMIAGLVFINIGLWQWHKEQRVINRQLQRREQIFRQHSRIDGLTSLADASCLREHADYLLKSENASSIGMLMIDVDQFNQVNLLYGASEGDRLLKELGDILLLNLRKQDLLCRFAGDRFAVLLPQAGHQLCQMIAQQLQASIAHFAFKVEPSGETAYQTISIGVAISQNNETVNSLIQRCTTAMLKVKQQKDVENHVA